MTTSLSLDSGTVIPTPRSQSHASESRLACTSQPQSSVLLWALLPFRSHLRLVSFDPDIVIKVANVTTSEAEGHGITPMFSSVLDLAHELSCPRVKENCEDLLLVGEKDHAVVAALQSGSFGL
jgi:hypothetical protein